MTKVIVTTTQEYDDDGFLMNSSTKETVENENGVLSERTYEEDFDDDNDDDNEDLEIDIEVETVFDDDEFDGDGCDDDDDEDYGGIQRVGEFQKVSFGQFNSSMIELLGGTYTKEDIEGFYSNLQLPARATNGSAGYDFRAPFTFVLYPGVSVKVPTGVRVAIDDGWFLGCLPRSGLGIKYRLQLDNTIGIIDGDYYESDNEGHIFASIINKGHEKIEIHCGDRFMQGVFIPYGITYTDSAEETRNGGFGSTGA